jgi:hypothetical protein
MLAFASGGARWRGMAKHGSGDICVQYQTTTMTGTCSTFSCGLAALCNAPRLRPCLWLVPLLLFSISVEKEDKFGILSLAKWTPFSCAARHSPIPEPRKNRVRYPLADQQRRRSPANPQLHKIRGGWERCGGAGAARTDSAANRALGASRGVFARPSSKLSPLVSLGFHLHSIVWMVSLPAESAGKDSTTPRPLNRWPAGIMTGSILFAWPDVFIKNCRR